MFEIEQYARQSLVSTLQGDGRKRVSRVCTDTREIGRGDLYIALVGKNFDGHDFVRDAIEAGVSGCMVSRRALENSNLPDFDYLVVNDPVEGISDLAGWWRSRLSPIVIGITGSTGKTTVKEMLTQILKQEFGEKSVLSTIGNFNNDIGVPKTLLELRSFHKFAVVEMGMNRFGEIESSAKVSKPHFAIITNVGSAHIGELGSEENIAKAKSEIICGLGGRGTLFVDANGKFTNFFKECAQTNDVITFGESEGANFRASIDRESASNFGSTKIRLGSESGVIKLAVPGKHNALNAMAAAAVAHHLGVSSASIRCGLESFHGVKGRLEITQLSKSQILINDTYNANFESMCAAIDSIAESKSKTILICGDMGELGESGPRLHERVGDYAKAKGIDILLGIGDLAKNTCIAFGSGGYHFDDDEGLIERLRGELSQDVVVLVKGSRFMKMEKFCEYLIADSTFRERT